MLRYGRRAASQETACRLGHWVDSRRSDLSIVNIGTSQQLFYLSRAISFTFAWSVITLSVNRYMRFDVIHQLAAQLLEPTDAAFAGHKADRSHVAGKDAANEEAGTVRPALLR